MDLAIFDCDGVLVDSEPIANRILADELTKIGLPTSYRDSIKHYMGKSEADSMSLITEKLGYSPPGAFFKDFQRKLFNVFEIELQPIQGIADALQRISCRMCVASSGSYEKMEKTLGMTNLLTFFEDRIFSASEVERGKPNPDLFLYAAKKMGVSPELCAVVEDSVPGVQAGVAAGMKVFGYVALSNAESLTDAGAQVFNTMNQLPCLLTDLKNSS